MVVACILPWWMVGGGETGITAESGNGFEGAGIVVFLVGIVVLALVALPYAAGDRPLGIDRWISFLILTAAGWIGLASASSSSRPPAPSRSASRPRSSRTARACGSRRSA